MLSLSDNEFSVLSFLVRNFTEKLTIRSIAQKLDFSPAGVFNILKKLEKHNIVQGQKLGTGLFYSINLESKIGRHLAAIVLLYSEEKMAIDTAQLKHARAAIFDRKTLLLITDSMTSLDISIPNISIVTRTDDEFTALLRKKDAETMQILRKGAVILGEDKIVEAIKKCVTGF